MTVIWCLFERGGESPALGFFASEESAKFHLAWLAQVVGAVDSAKFYVAPHMVRS